MNRNQLIQSDLTKLEQAPTLSESHRQQLLNQLSRRYPFIDNDGNNTLDRLNSFHTNLKGAWLGPNSLNILIHNYPLSLISPQYTYESKRTLLRDLDADTTLINNVTTTSNEVKLQLVNTLQMKYNIPLNGTIPSENLYILKEYISQIGRDTMSGGRFSQYYANQSHPLLGLNAGSGTNNPRTNIHTSPSSPLEKPFSGGLGYKEDYIEKFLELVTKFMEKIIKYFF